MFNVQVRMVGFPARSASFRTKRDAQRWVSMIEGQMVEGKHFRTAEARHGTLGDAIERYLREEAPKKRGKHMHKTTLRWWKDQIGNVKMADVTPALIAECRDRLASIKYRRARPESKRTTLKEGQRPQEFKRQPGTVNRYLACLGHLFTIARREWHWIGHNPMDGVSKLPEGKGRVRTLSDTERRALLAETAKNKILHAFVVSLPAFERVLFCPFRASNPTYPVGEAGLMALSDEKRPRWHSEKVRKAAC